MKLQAYQQKSEKIRQSFLELKKKHPERLSRKLSLSWSNWGFGIEPLSTSAARLSRAGIRFIELHGNHYGPALGYRAKETLKILGRQRDHGGGHLRDVLRGQRPVQQQGHPPPGGRGLPGA